MKKVLITGADSYIGTSFENYISKNYPDDYIVDTVDMIDDAWKVKNFTGYDTVFHVAGIAHQKETKENADLYYKVNRDLAVETAKKAKLDGVKQFIFLSSMSVYGMDIGVITKETEPSPTSHYGKSKWQAEKEIEPLNDDNFKVCILRPPMVYGDGCKGNYQFLVRIATHFPVLPDYENKRSMIHIDNLSECVKLYIDKCSDGIYFPQDKSYVCTCKMIMDIRKKMGKQFKTVKIFNPVIRIFAKFVPKGRKAFGDLIYCDSDSFNLCE